MVQAQRREAAEAQRDVAKAERRRKRELRKQKTVSELDTPAKAAMRNTFGFDGAGLEALHGESEPTRTDLPYARHEATTTPAQP